MGRGLSNNDVAEVYRRYGHLMLRRCRVVLRDDSLADDALQEAFIKLMRYGVQLQKVDARLRWLYRVTDRCCFDVLSQRVRLKEDHKPVEDPGTPHPAIRLEVRDAVMSLLHRLEEQERMLAMLHFVDGKEQGEIAAEMDWSSQTVGKRLQAIREQAEQQLGSEDG